MSNAQQGSPYVQNRPKVNFREAQKHLFGCYLYGLFLPQIDERAPSEEVEFSPADPQKEPLPMTPEQIAALPERQVPLLPPEDVEASLDLVEKSWVSVVENADELKARLVPAVPANDVDVQHEKSRGSVGTIIAGGYAVSIVAIVMGAVFGELSEDSVQLVITTTAPLVAIIIGYYFGKNIND